MCVNRRFFVTETGFFGLGPAVTETKDRVCVLFGGEVPFVCRFQSVGSFELCGECYVHKMMHGEAEMVRKEENKYFHFE